MLRDDDLEEIQRTGHSLKGSGGGYGFDELTRIGAALEEAAADGDATSIAAELEVLADYLERVEVVYR